jgi:hypothetical protein
VIGLHINRSHSEHRQVDGGPSSIFTFSEPGRGDGGHISADLGENRDMPGVWSQGIATPDTGSTISLMTLTFMALGLVARQFKRAAACPRQGWQKSPHCHSATRPASRFQKRQFSFSSAVKLGLLTTLWQDKSSSMTPVYRTLSQQASGLDGIIPSVSR